jgi:hypothetical protein
MGYNTTSDRLLDSLRTKQDEGNTSLATIATDAAASKSSNNTTQSEVTQHNSRAFGQGGCILVTGTAAVTATAGSGSLKFVAIQFLEDTVFDSASGGLVATTENLYLDDDATGAGVASGGGGANTDGITFPKGMTLFGRYDGFKLASGKVVAYVG